LTANKVITKKYTSKKAYIRVKGAIMNQVNGRQIPLDCECRIDTGFDGGLMIPFWHKDEIETIDVQPRLTNITIADGSTVPALICAVHIQEVENQTFPMPGRPVMLVMCGNRKGDLLGMDALKQSTILFDGPNQKYTMNL
jgi:predicted aspartyl protease